MKPSALPLDQLCDGLLQEREGGVGCVSVVACCCIYQIDLCCLAWYDYS